MTSHVALPVALSTADVRLLAALVGVTSVVTTWLAVSGPQLDMGHPIPVLAVMLIGLTAIGLAARNTRTPSFDRESARFWALVAAAQMVVVLGVLWAGVAWRGYDATGAARALSAAAIVAQPILLVAMVTYWVTPWSSLDRVKYALDVVTITGGGLLVLWYDVNHSLVDGVTVAAGDLALVHTAAISDLILLFTASVLWRRTASATRSNVLVLCSLGLLVQFVTDVGAVVELHRTGGRPPWLLAAMPVAACLIAAAAWLHRTSASVSLPRASVSTPGSSAGSSLIPYVAVLPGFGLLLKAAIETGVQPLAGLVIGGVVLTGLAFARQAVSTRETVRFLAESSARESEARFRALVQHASDVITIVDADGTIRYASPSVQAVFGHEPRQLVGTSLVQLLHPEDVETAQQFLAELAAASGTGSLGARAALTREWRLSHANGSWLTVDNIGTNLLSEPTVQGLVLNTRDVTERRVMEEQYMHQAFHDPLTDLANRSLFLYQVGHALARASRHQQPVTVLFLDLDNFKNVNDSLGHAAGDRLLVEAARRLSACVRHSDLIARLGGDEFAVLIEDTDSVDEVLAMADRIVESLGRAFNITGKEVFLSASIGIARTDARETSDELVRNADVAMYIAKNRGKGQFVLFEPAMHAAALERLEVEADLRRAAERNELYLEFQPIVALDGGEVCGAEALLRWRRQERGTVPPSVFIPVAEETGLIVEIGRWVLHEACKQGRRWQDDHGAPVRMTVNLSGRQLQDPKIVDDVAHALETSGFTPNQLVLEITESILMHHVEVSLDRLTQLKELGVSLAIDDFGTGYSSLSYLQRYPIDILKIDKAFVDTVDQGGDGAVLASAIVALCDTLRLDTVAEGIETDAQRGTLLQLGCAFGQGYLFAPAVGAAEFAHLMHTRGTRVNDSLRRRHGVPVAV